MKPGRVVVLVSRIEVLCYDLGLWCRTCNLSSGVRVWFTATIGERTTLRSTLGCTECEGENVAD